MRIGSQVDIFLYRLQVIRKEGGWIVCARTIHWMASKTNWVVSVEKIRVKENKVDFFS